jgi:phosphonopyruvate decarboxylase
VVVADGDGAALMRMGNFATLGAYGGANLRHLVLDNGVHESTGGQSTVSAGMSFAGVARACGYRSAEEGLSIEDLGRFLAAESGPAMLHLHTRRGVPDGLPRPDVKPRQVKQRLMAQIGVAAPWANL